ncbi:hypothetical protein CDL12_28352 [Handroanthus impetiginosus]|uniref:Morc S5 domain-containing protein n=1 Tax=Handroanthus impetiginosus TaxID=429701 RepID=A0A2G9G1F1_9LAMI|nr:hypothetical protein CDL12_28352 [Handroanthus impetiginosus]
MRWQLFDTLKMQKSILLSYEVVALKTFLLAFVSFLHCVTFWRARNAAGRDGRGVTGALEANFVEPRHDKKVSDHTICAILMFDQVFE